MEIRCLRVSKASARASRNSILRMSREISICSAWLRRIGGGGRGDAMGEAFTDAQKEAKEKAVSRTRSGATDESKEAQVCWVA